MNAFKQVAGCAKTAEVSYLGNAATTAGLRKLGFAPSSVTGPLDDFDMRLINLVQRDDARTAESLSEDVPLSPSAISRRLRRLRSEGWIRSIALLSPELTDSRLQAVVLIQLDRHGDREARFTLEQKLAQSETVQFCCETSGSYDLLALFDCRSMTHFMSHGDELIASDPAVRHYETYFIKRRVKFAPFIDLLASA